MSVGTDQLPLFGEPGSEGSDSELGRHAALHRAGSAARRCSTASIELAAAVKVARQRGCTWREIARATGLPHQSLHHRYGGPLR